MWQKKAELHNVARLQPELNEVISKGNLNVKMASVKTVSPIVFKMVHLESQIKCESHGEEMLSQVIIKVEIIHQL